MGFRRVHSQVSLEGCLSCDGPQCLPHKSLGNTTAVLPRDLLFLKMWTPDPRRCWHLTLSSLPQTLRRTAQ